MNIPNEAIQAAWDAFCAGSGENMDAAIEAAAQHIQACAIEDLAEARNEDDTKFIFTWGQRDWMCRYAVDIRTGASDAHE